MKIVKQLCIKSWEITAQNGDRFEIKQGKIYTTSVPREDEGNICVFSTYWVNVPKDKFVICEEQ